MKQRSLLLCLSVGMLACGSVDAGQGVDAQIGGAADGAAGPDGPAGVSIDATPGAAPTIVSIEPADGAVGVRTSADVVITFSEPMDPVSTVEAWVSVDLPRSGLAFSWNAEGTVLTVDPVAPLVLAEGTGLDPSTVPRQTYAFTLDTTARSAAGVDLAAPVTSSFATSRRLVVDTVPVAALTRSMRGDGVVFAEAAVTVLVGDTVANLQVKTFATFTLPVLPAGAVIERGTLRATQGSVVAAPYAGGPMRTLHMAASVIDATAFTATPLAVLGDLSTDATLGVKSRDVTAAVRDDLTHRVARGGRSQYRLEFAAVSSDGSADEARFSRSSLGLELAYLVD
jgi:hypothetical protein